jgi:hypothetical protein
MWKSYRLPIDEQKALLMVGAAVTGARVSLELREVA